jgi:hypothetical protein
MHTNEPLKKKSGNNEIEEIDLKPIIKLIKSFFTGIITLIKFIIYSIIKMPVFIIICTFIGLSIGLFSFYNEQPMYITSMTLTSNLLTNGYCKNLIDDLQSIKDDNNNELLATKLNINTTDAAAIQKLSYKDFTKEIDIDTAAIGTPFIIEMAYYDNSIIESVEAGLVNYLENNQYAQARKVVKKEQLQSMGNVIIKEIADLDSLKEVIASNLSPRGSGSGFVYGQPLDPVNVYKETLDLHARKLELDSKIKLIDNIELINSFNKKITPASPNLYLKILTGVSLGFCFGLLIALFKARDSFNKMNKSSSDKSDRILA